MGQFLVPSYYTAPYEPSNVPVDARKYYSWSQLSDSPVTTADLFKELVRIKRSHLIRWIACLHVWLSRQRGLDMRMQTLHAKALLPQDAWTKLESIILKDGRDCGAIFHKRQLWLMLQFACLVCPEDTPELPEKEAGEAFSRAALMTSDILAGIELDGQDDPPEDFIAMLIPMTEKRMEAQILVRAYAFWFELPTKDDLPKKAEECRIDLAAVFQEKYSISLSEFFHIVSYLWLLLNTQADPKQISPRLFPYPAPNFAEIFAEKYMLTVLGLLSQTPEQLSLRMLRKPRQSWSYDATVLRERPLLEFTKGTFTAPDISLLHACLLDRVFFLLQEASKAFRQYFGYLFEAYIHKVIHLFAPKTSRLVRRYYHQLKFQGQIKKSATGFSPTTTSAS